MTLLKNLLQVFLLSMLPVTELRGAIPFGLAFGYPALEVLVVAIVGNLLPTPLIMLCARYVMSFCKRFPVLRTAVAFVERKTHAHAPFIHKYGRLGLFILVAVPLPGTGAWTGSLVAAFLGMRLKHALPVIAAGVCVAGILVTALSLGVIHFFN